jgi:hypothetical protein
MRCEGIVVAGKGGPISEYDQRAAVLATIRQFVVEATPEEWAKFSAARSAYFASRGVVVRS